MHSVLKHNWQKWSTPAVGWIRTHCDHGANSDTLNTKSCELLWL